MPYEKISSIVNDLICRQGESRLNWECDISYDVEFEGRKSRQTIEKIRNVKIFKSFLADWVMGHGSFPETKSLSDYHARFDSKATCYTDTMTDEWESKIIECKRNI